MVAPDDQVGAARARFGDAAEPKPGDVEVNQRLYVPVAVVEQIGCAQLARDMSDVVA